MVTRQMGYCSKCREKSVVIKIYNGGKRVEYCINKGCGYKLTLPPLREGVEDEVEKT